MSRPLDPVEEVALDFDVRWLDYRGKAFATTHVRRCDLSAAVLYAARKLARPGSSPRSEGPGRRHPAADAHGVFVEQAP